MPCRKKKHNTQHAQQTASKDKEQKPQNIAEATNIN